MADIETAPVSGTGNQVVGKVSILYGTVKAMSPDGTVRVLDVNSPVYADDQIITESDGSVSIILDDPTQTHLDIGRMSNVVIDEDVYGGVAPADVAEVAAEVEEIQQALLAGDELEDVEMEATAAGGTAAAGGGITVYTVEATGEEVTPEAFAETEGYEEGTVDTIPGINEPPAEPEPEPEPEPAPPPPPNNPPEIVVNVDGIGDTVYEAGLAAGSDAASDSEFASGSFTVSDSDGLDDIDSITIGGTTFEIGTGPGQFASLSALVGQTVNVGYGTVELTSYADGTFGYDYTLNLNVDNDSQAGATDAGYDESFDVSVSDGAASATATITIGIVDDIPEAAPDPASVDVNDGESSASATLAGLIAVTGADGASVTHLNGAPIADGVPVAGTYGTLTVSGGSYYYTAYEGFTNPAEYTPDQFTFTVTDGDGDTDTVTVTFNVLDNEGPSVEVVAETLTVDETGIDGVDDVAPGDDIGTGGPTDNSETTSGTLNIDTGGDAYQLLVNGIPIPAGGTSIQGLYGDLTINAAGVWSYTLDKNYPSHTPGDPNDLATGVDNFNITVTDDSGTFPDATTTLSINILDDGPAAVPDPAAVDVNDGESSASATLASLIAATGADGASVTHLNGAPIVDGVPVAGTYGTLTVSGGSYYYTAYENFTNPAEYTPDQFTFTVTDGDGDTDTVTLTFNVLDNEGPSVEVVAETLTVDETGIDGVDDVAPGDDIGTGGPTDNSESTNGTLNIDTGGDAYQLLVNGIPIPAGGTSIQGAYGDLTINAAGVWSYTLDNNYLGHTAGDPNDLAPGMEDFEITVTDDSGMNADATTHLVIDILDDGPVVAADYDAILANEYGQTNSLTADLDIQFGADGPAAINALSIDSPPVDEEDHAIDNSLNPLTSDGTPLIYVSDGSGGWTAVTDDAQQTPIFTVSVDAGTETYSVNLVGLLDGAPIPFDVNLPGDHTGGLSTQPVFQSDIDGDGVYDVTVTATAATSTIPLGSADVNFNAHSIGVETGNDINGAHGDLLHLEFTDPDDGTYQTYQTMDVTFEQFDGSSETAYVQAYIHDSGGNLVPVGTLIEIDGAGDTFTVTPGGLFDTLEFTAAADTKYKVASVGGTDYTQGADHTITFDVTATDGDGDTDSDSFDVTFDGDGVLDGDTGESEVIVGGTGIDTIYADDGAHDIIDGGDGADLIDVDGLDTLVPDPEDVIS